MSQMKQQDKITVRELNEIEIGNRPDREFKVTVMKRLNGLESRTSMRPSTKR